MQFSSNCSCPLLHRSDYSCRPIFSVLSSLLIYLTFFHRVTIFSICLLDWLHSRRQIIRYYEWNNLRAWCYKMHHNTYLVVLHVAKYTENKSSIYQFAADDCPMMNRVTHIAKIYVAELLKRECVYFFPTNDYFLQRDDPRCAILMPEGKTRRQKLQEYRTIGNRKKRREREREWNRKSKRLVTTSSRAQSSCG